MTEADWLACTDADALLIWMEARDGKQPRSRKLRLFSCACCRRVPCEDTGSQSLDLLDVAEKFADGLLTERDLEQARTGDNWFRHDAVEWAAWPPSKEYQGPLQSAARACAGIARSASGLPAAESIAQCHLLRDIFWTPYRRTTANADWLTRNDNTVKKIAEGIYVGRAFDRLPILADALEDAGCDNADILAHCRGPGPHARGCWAIDLLLGKE